MKFFYKEQTAVFLSAASLLILYTTGAYLNILWAVIALLPAGLASAAVIKNREIRFRGPGIIFLVTLYASALLIAADVILPLLITGTGSYNIYINLFLFISVLTHFLTGFMLILLKDYSDPENRNRLISENTIPVAMLLLLLILINILSTRLDFTVDLTAAGSYTLSEQGAEALKEVGRPVEITAFFPFFHDYHREVDLFLQSLGSRFDHINYRMVDAMQNRDLAIRKEVDRNGYLVFESMTETGEINRRKLSVTTRSHLRSLERDSIKALLSVSSERTRICYTASHGELTDEGPFQNETASIFFNELKAQNFELHPLRVNEHYPSEGVPADCRILMILKALKEPPRSEMAAITGYVKSGRPLFLALDTDAVALPALQKALAIDYRQAVVHSMLTQNKSRDVILATSYSEHPVTSRLPALPQQARFTLFSVAGYFTREAGKNRTAAGPDYLIQTDSRSWLDKNSDNTLNRGERQAVFSLAAAVDNALVFSDADFLRNRLINYGRNLDVAVNGMKWLSDNRALTGSLPERTGSAPLRLTQGTNDIIFYMLVYIWPLLILTGGFFTVRKFRRRLKNR